VIYLILELRKNGFLWKLVRKSKLFPIKTSLMDRLQFSAAAGLLRAHPKKPEYACIMHRG
jgi:hypothetical protein